MPYHHTVMINFKTRNWHKITVILKKNIKFQARTDKNSTYLLSKNSVGYLVSQLELNFYYLNFKLFHSFFLLEML